MASRVAAALRGRVALGMDGLGFCLMYTPVDFLPLQVYTRIHEPSNPFRPPGSSVMLDGVSLDQLRTFIAAVEEGSFSAPVRRLRRAQSLVSQTLANLEGQLGVKLFDRSAHRPLLTDHGRALLADAREV